MDDKKSVELTRLACSDGKRSRRTWSRECGTGSIRASRFSKARRSLPTITRPAGGWPATWFTPIALERLRYRPETGQVIYYGRQRGRSGESEASPARIFPALDFLAALCTHVPDSGQQLVRYYGTFSNARRVSAQAPASASAHPADPQPRRQDDSDNGEEFARARRRSWARLIKKVYEADPLVCPRCSGPLKIISLIGDSPVIEKILRRLKLWDRPGRPPPRPAARPIHYNEEIVNRDRAGQGPDATP